VNEGDVLVDYGSPYRSVLGSGISLRTVRREAHAVHYHADSDYRDWLGYNGESDRVVNLVYLAIGGFLVGSFLYTGWYTTQYEPNVRPGYVVVGMGIVLSVILNSWLTFYRPEHTWFRFLTLGAYALVALGLLFIVRERRKGRK